jgi:hypothetical protein
MTLYRLVKRDGKFLIKRGFLYCTYLDMHYVFWWCSPEIVSKYCLADSEELALNQLKKYKESIIAEKKKSKSKTLKWWFV